MPVRYSTNWMGPVSMDWYRKRDLTRKVTITAKGESVETEDIIERWAGGRIDVSGEGIHPYDDELSLPIMCGTSYRLFSEWLDTFETDHPWTLEQIVELYERNNPKIRWAKDVFGDR